MLNFSSSSFDAVTITTATDAASEDNDEAPTKDSFNEEASDGTAGADGLSNALAMTDGGGGSSSLIIINITQQISITAVED